MPRSLEESINAAGSYDPRSLEKLLRERTLLPEWAQTLPYGEDVSGEYFPGTNRMVVNYPDNSYRRNSAAHETTHAVQHNLLRSAAQYIAEKQWQKQDVSPQEERYLKAMSTLMNEQYGRIGQYNREEASRNKSSLENILARLFKKPDDMDKNYYEYRTRPGELQAYGVGNMSGESSHRRQTPAHVDPTFATEFDILQEMYKTLPEVVKARAASERAAAIQKYREQERPDYNYKEYPKQSPY